MLIPLLETGMEGTHAVGRVRRRECRQTVYTDHVLVKMFYKGADFVMRKVDARSFQNFPAGFMLDGEWERPQTLRTGQDHKGFAIVVFTISWNPNRGAFSLTSCGTSADQVGKNL